MDGYILLITDVYLALQLRDFIGPPFDHNECVGLVMLWYGGDCIDSVTVFAESVG